MRSASDCSNHQTLTVCYAQILQDPGINPLPTLEAQPRAGACMPSSQSTAVHGSKAAAAAPLGSAPAGGTQGSHSGWELAPGGKSLTSPVRFRLPCSRYLPDGLMEHPPNDSHFVAAVRSPNGVLLHPFLSCTATYLPALAERNSSVDRSFLTSSKLA